MIHLNEIPLDFEPRREILPLVPEFILPEGCEEPEMSEFDSAFLCGVLKKFRPKKILEVGIASGATTAIILQALEDCGTPYEMHSVDLHLVHIVSVDDKKYLIKSEALTSLAKGKNLLPPPSQL